LNWTSLAPFDANTASDEGGVELVVIPAVADLENVILPPEANFFEDEFSGTAPVIFEWQGREHTCTLRDFMQTGLCRPAAGESG
jgi:hypothetical protein